MAILSSGRCNARIHAEYKLTQVKNKARMIKKGMERKMNKGTQLALPRMKKRVRCGYREGCPEVCPEPSSSDTRNNDIFPDFLVWVEWGVTSLPREHPEQSGAEIIHPESCWKKLPITAPDPFFHAGLAFLRRRRDTTRITHASHIIFASSQNWNARGKKEERKGEKKK